MNMGRSASLAKIMAGLVLALALAAASGYAWLSRHVAEPPRQIALKPASLAWPGSVEISDEAWSTFEAPSTPESTALSGPLNTRFRLAGTFFLYGGDGTSQHPNRRAIIDDLQGGQQSIVQEGDQLNGGDAAAQLQYEVTQIFTDRIILRSDGVDYELALSFAAPLASEQLSNVSTAEAQNVSLEDMPALESNRFGKRVGENRWVLQREELLNYYREVLDDPERIAAIYSSLKPEYQENEIGGYRLASDGEAEFFAQMGLRESDVIRKVNSMRMVSQRRAEYFLSEFLKDRVNALVLDVEREGKPEKLIYLIR